MGDGSTVAKAMYSHEGPALVCQWSPVSGLFFSCFDIYDGLNMSFLWDVSHSVLFLSFLHLPLKDGSKLASGGADNAGRMFDVSTGQSTQFAKHDAPVKGLRWVETNIVATGSWDKTIKVRRGRKLHPAYFWNMS